MTETGTGPAGPTVGWIGTGRMGAAMATRLARAGVDVRAWNRTRAKAEPLAAHGASIADTIAELRDRDVVFTMVSTPADLAQVLVGDGGLIADPDQVPGLVVDCSTVSTESSEAMRAACAERGVEFLAAPVSGNGKVVSSGGLSMVASGPEAAFERAAPLLRHIGKSVTYVGDGDTARLVKICHNLFLGVVTQSMAEITVLAERGGVSRAAFLEFLNNSVMGSVFTRYKSPAFVNLDYTPTFTPVLLRKDFDLGLAAARAMDVPMPVAAMTAQLVQATVSGGRITEDFAILLDQQAAAAGMVLKPEDVPVDDGLSGDGDKPAGGGSSATGGTGAATGSPANAAGGAVDAGGGERP
nr:NAD(P)-dependent oxidoreductase [Micromonospora sp. DSM 115978]